MTENAAKSIHQGASFPGFGFLLAEKLLPEIAHPFQFLKPVLDRCESEYKFNRMDEVIFERYKKDGADTISNMNNWTSDERNLNQRYQKWLKAKKKLRHDKDMLIDPFEQVSSTSFHVAFDLMITDGLVIKDGNQLKINQSIKKTLTNFVLFLTERGELKKESDGFKLEMAVSDTEAKSEG